MMSCFSCTRRIAPRLFGTAGYVALLAAGVLGLANPAAAQTLPGEGAPPPRQDGPGAEPPIVLPSGTTEPQAQAEAQAAGTQVFVPADFAAFAPRSALDMILQIPGFQIVGIGGGGPAARGLGQASGNLLLNGERLSSKSVSPQVQLGRIPVENVIRIEVVDGATFGIPGLSGRVANIVAEVGRLAGQFEWRPEWSTGPARVGLNDGDASISAVTGPVEYTLALAVATFRRGSEGPAIFTQASGLVDERHNFQQANFDRPELSGNFRIQVSPDVVANLNLLGNVLRYRSVQDENRIAGNPLPTFRETFNNGNDQWAYEVGGDIDFPLGPGRMRLIGLDNYRNGEFTTTSSLLVGALDPRGTRFIRGTQVSERILRSEYSWQMFGASWQIASEAAFNALNQDGRLFVFDPAADEFVERAFPAGVGGVGEDRYESLLSVGFPLRENLTVQVVAGPEYSSIFQTGANALSRTFLRGKGSVTLGWAPQPGFDFSLRLERRVGQLNFMDFLASVSLIDENASAGNNELRPEQTWATTLEVARDFGAWGTLNIRLFDERIEDPILFIPVPGGEARGNIESAQRSGVRVRGTLQTGPLGIAGGRFDLTMTAEDSELLDPVTLVGRRFDGLDPFEIRLDWRHDVPGTDYAWGTEFRQTSRAPSLRLEQENFEFAPNTWGAFFIEHKDFFGTVVRLRVGNLFNGEAVRMRTIYSGPRNVAPILFTEDRRRRIGQTFNLTVSGNF